MGNLVYLGLGSNQGERQLLIEAALRDIKVRRGVELLRVSPYYETEPVGKKDQPWFLNAVCEVLTDLQPGELLHVIKEVELRLGRVRLERWGPRTMDIDILLYGRLQMETPELVIPHPRIKERAFVLRPLQDLNPGLVFPDGESLTDVVSRLQYSEKVLPWIR